MGCGQAMQQPASLPVSAPERREHRNESKADDELVAMCAWGNVEKDTADGISTRKCAWIERAIIVILLAIVIGLATALAECRSARCPYDWIGHKGKCYYVSEKEGNWTASESFCSAHVASLARIDEKEKDFVRRITGNRPSWIGLHRKRDHDWKWTNGEKPLLEVLGDGGDCAYLNDEGKASSARCSSEHHWICNK